jgi:hypothetical protein
MFQKIVTFLDSKKEEMMSSLSKLKEKEKDILVLKENLQKLKFGGCKIYKHLQVDLRWSLEMGDCEVNIVDAEGKPRGGLRVNNNTQVNKMMKKFIETENLLVHTKVSWFGFV